MANIIRLIFSSSREQSKYRRILSDPSERQTSKHFGRRSIANCIWALVCSAIALACAFGFHVWIGGYEFNAAAIIFVVAMYAVGAAAVCFALAGVFLHFRTFRYARFQRKINRLPIGKAAVVWCVICLLINLAAAVGTAAILLTTFLSIF